MGAFSAFMGQKLDTILTQQSAKNKENAKLPQNQIYAKSSEIYLKTSKSRNLLAGAQGLELP